MQGVEVLPQKGSLALRLDPVQRNLSQPLTLVHPGAAWVLCSSLISLFWLGPAAGSANTGIVFGLLTLVSVGFYFTILGVHHSIRETKHETLHGLTDGIRRAGAALRSEAQRGDSLALADLVAYYGFIERLPEWPLGGASLVRAALIAALGIGSWLGGALVERMIDSFF